MSYTAKQYATALYQAIHDAGPKDQEKILDNFLQVLQEHNQLALAPEIEAEFLNYDRESRGMKLAEVTSARPLSREQESKVVKELNDYIGSDVELKKKLDEGLIGGVVIRIDDEIIDGSIKTQLNQLKDRLIN